MISVCMATYNGELFIREQLDSIVKQLHEEDELIISDDGSKDGTLSIINDYMQKYQFIKLLKGPGKGVVKNFENAIRHAQGEIIFLSDQDDIWMEGRVAKSLKLFEDKACNVVLHDAKIIDAKGELLDSSFFARRGSKRGIINNFIKNSYIGCCMSFRANMRERILPFPEKIEMHDWWIGMVAEVGAHTRLNAEPLLLYRRHGNNVSSFKRYPIKRMLMNRMYLVLQLIKRMIWHK